MKEKPKNKNNKDKFYYLLAFLVAIICFAGVFLIIFNQNKDKKEEEKDLAYTELIKQIDEGSIEKCRSKN